MHFLWLLCIILLYIRVAELQSKLDNAMPDHKLGSESTKSPLTLDDRPNSRYEWLSPHGETSKNTLAWLCIIHAIYINTIILQCFSVMVLLMFLLLGSVCYKKKKYTSILYSTKLSQGRNQRRDILTPCCHVSNGFGVP